MMFTAFEEHETRFAQELSRRVAAKVCADIAAMSRNLDLLDPQRALPWYDQSERMQIALSEAFVAFRLRRVQTAQSTAVHF
jgi:hypothetical protein